ncbi:MAG: NAD(P)H-hydrate dehydratase [Myxococcales bacterium]|nr:NAD(P)H-hydrate dehydratase [Myxococcales bacterium]
MWPLVSAEQMRLLDADTISRLGVPGSALMENAGRGVVEVLWQLHREGAIDLFQARVVLLAGPGNNGGDGMVIARYLHGRGIGVRLYLCAERDRVRGDARLHMQAALAAGVCVHDCPSETETRPLALLLQGLGSQDLIIDALFGTGLHKTLTGHLAQLVHAANASRARRLAVDLPSGLDADTGLPSDAVDLPSPAIVQADYTVTFGFPKLGLLGAPGFTWAGAIYLVDIGIPDPTSGPIAVRARLLDARCLLRLAQPRSPLGHKGTHGHLLVVAGSIGKTGAALLCTRAALRTGVGLCTLLAPSSVVEHALSGQVLEAMSWPYELAMPGEPDAAALIQAWLQAAHGKQAIAIGPGLPVGPHIKHALLSLIENGTAPMVLDADALNQVVGEDALLLRAQKRGRELVLTPHPGEAARLLGTTVRQVQASRNESARRLCQRTAAVVVLKGARTVIAAPSPAAAGDAQVLPIKDIHLSVCPTGNSGMGTGGMGDVLTGLLGALLTAGWPAYDAACAAVYWHGRAGDWLSARRAPGSLLCAGDLVEALDAARSDIVSACTEPPAASWPITRL